MTGLTLTLGVPLGTTTVQGLPVCRAAQATAWPWLPELWVTIIGAPESGAASRQHRMPFRAPFNSMKHVNKAYKSARVQISV